MKTRYRAEESADQASRSALKARLGRSRILRERVFRKFREQGRRGGRKGGCARRMI
jgi:hypothetical protein